MKDGLAIDDSTSASLEAFNFLKESKIDFPKPIIIPAAAPYFPAIIAPVAANDVALEVKLSAAA